MKQIYFLTIVLFLSVTNLIAQPEIVLDGLNNAHGLAIDDNGTYLYYAETGAGTIYRINITASNPQSTRVSIATGLNAPTSLALDDNGTYLYFVHSGGANISKINISVSGSSELPVATGLSNVMAILVSGTDLYFHEATLGELLKFDLTWILPFTGISQTTQVLTDMRASNMPSALLLDDNYLYISGHNTSGVSRIDINNGPLNPTQTPTPIASVTCGGFARVGTNDLYIGEFDLGEISKIDIMGTNPQTPWVVASGLDLGLDHPLKLAAAGNVLYYTHFNSESNISSIFKLDLTCISATNLTNAYTCNSIIPISWISANPTGAINIKLLNGSGAWVEDIETNYTGSSPYQWTLPAYLENCNGFFKISIENTAGGCSDETSEFWIFCCSCDCGEYASHKIGLKCVKPKSRKTLERTAVFYRNCGYRDIFIKPGTRLGFTFPSYECNPTECEAEYKWEIEKGISLNPPLIGMGFGSNFDYIFTQTGSFNVVFTPKCGDLECEPCSVLVLVGKNRKEAETAGALDFLTPLPKVPK